MDNYRVIKMAKWDFEKFLRQQGIIEETEAFLFVSSDYGVKTIELIAYEEPEAELLGINPERTEIAEARKRGLGKPSDCGNNHACRS